MNEIINDLWVNLQGYYTDFIEILPKFLVATFVFSLLFFLANRSQRIVNSRLGSRMDDPLLARFLAREVKTAIVLFALMIVMKILGLADIAAGLITGAGVGAIVIGFAFKDIGENFLAGIMLAFNRPFRIGDTVELGGHKGTVISLEMRTTQIKTFDGKDIYIPNASVVKNPVINYTIDGFIRQEFNIGLDYGSDVDKAMELIEEAIAPIQGIVKDNASKTTNIYIGELNSSTINITVQYWLNTFDKKYPGRKIRNKIINTCLESLGTAGFYMPGDIIELKNYNEKEIKTAGATLST